jgi:HD-like signal output (HDOD) protein
MLKRFGNPKSCPVTRFTMHSEAVAVLADVLCDHLPVDFPDGAYVAGLIHDVGRLVIAHMCGELAADFIAKQVLAGVPVTECERNVLGIDHAEVSGIAAAMWQLPEPVGNAVHFHHSPPAADGENSVLPLALVLAKADTFVNALGLSITPDVPLPEPRIEIAGHESQIREALKTFETMLRQNQAYASSANK